jgi:hypothetical protein
MNPSLLENKSDEWLTVTTNKKRNLKVNKKANLAQHFQIPICINRYAVLDNLQNKTGLPQEHSEIIQGGSNVTGTNCDLFTHKSVPVIFEPPCKYNIK